MMKRGPQADLDKKLSIKNLLKIVKNSVNLEKTVQSKRGAPLKYTIKDSFLGALAMFSLKQGSLLQMDTSKQEEVTKHNLKKLYGLEQVPSDTHMRTVLDQVDPVKIRPTFLKLFEEIQRSKLLMQYHYPCINGYLLAIDGTGIFESKNVYCDNCCVKNHQNGTVGYYHQILAASIVKPGLKQVIPLCPEPITKQDGASKNDCEANALRRLLKDTKAEHPRLKFTIIADALSANTPTINFIESLDYNYIINSKPTANKNLFEWISGLNLQQTAVMKEENNYIFKYINQIPLNDHPAAPSVNFLECIMQETVGKKISEKTFTWVTNHKITDKNAYDLMLAGRARWKIENETFNTLKNQGYEFEHNFGHGKKNLHTIFAMTMMLAFLIDQIQEAACGLFQASIQKKHTRKYFWETLRSYFRTYLINDWDDLFNTIIHGAKHAQLTPNSC